MKKLFASLAMALGLLAPLGALAIDTTTQDQIQSGICANDPTHCKQTGDFFAKGGTFNKIADLLVFLVAAISVLMIIIGGLRYTLSGGDPSGTKGAKDTILYAIVGLIVATLSYAAVHFLIIRTL